MRSFLACLALAGCGASLPLPREPSAAGPCLQQTVSRGGKHTQRHLWKHGREISSDELDATLADFVPARDEELRARRTGRAGWVLFGIGLAASVVGWALAVALSPPPPPGTRRSPPWWPGFGLALGGEAFGISSLYGTNLVSTRQHADALALYNRHAERTGCRD